MAMVAAGATKEEKQAWLKRPFDLAYDAACFGGILTASTYYEPMFRSASVAFAMASLMAIFGLLLWGFRRMSIAGIF